MDNYSGLTISFVAKEEQVTIGQRANMVMEQI